MVSCILVYFSIKSGIPLPQVATSYCGHTETGFPTKLSAGMTAQWIA
jgi:hypothetical protein